eukprot:1188622-Prorocentrum_minimum.AAC.9
MRRRVAPAALASAARDRASPCTNQAPPCVRWRGGEWRLHAYIKNIEILLPLYGSSCASNGKGAHEPLIIARLLARLEIRRL